jgi:2-dehydro-3-deoxy-D-arabinonate dehydratase
MDVSLEAGDVVEINVAGVGTLTNTVEVIPERVK